MAEVVKKVVISGDSKVVEDIIKVISRMNTLCNGDSFKEVKLSIDGSKSTRIKVSVDGEKLESNQDNNFIIL